MNPQEHLILYVDDEHANRVVFAQTFAKRFRVTCVASALAALEVLQREPVALVVTDQRMPGMSGDELLERCKVAFPDTVRMVITAYSDLDPILKAVNDGLVVRYIVKPWDRAQLEEILNWALEAFELGRSNSAIQRRLVQTERLMTLGQVAAAINHDLRQPLSSIALNARLMVGHASVAPLLSQLASGAKPSLDTAACKRLSALALELPEISDELDQAAGLMTGVLNQLAEFQQTRETPLVESSVDPVPLVRMAVSLCRDEARTARCKVVNDVPAHLPRVRATTPQLLQILLNLLGNAQQAVGRNAAGGTVVLRTIDGVAHVGFVVSDDGPGMTPEIVAKLGTPFFTTRAEGTGLGVAQVRRLVATAGGSFEIESKEGTGTTVTFTIPKAHVTG